MLVEHEKKMMDREKQDGDIDVSARGVSCSRQIEQNFTMGRFLRKRSGPDHYRQGGEFPTLRG